MGEEKPHLKRNGFTLLETLIVVAVILTLVAMIVPNALRMRTVARKGTIVTDLQTLHDELGTYKMMCGGYPATLPHGSSAETGCSASPATKADSTSAPSLNSSADSIESAPTVMSGYRVTYTPADPGEDGMYHGYAITAEPLGGGRNGSDFYFSDQTGIIRIHIGASASSSDRPLAP